MDMNRRRLIGASAGVAGALAMSPDAARAAPLTSTFGRDVTQYGVRPGSSDDQTKNLQRAIDEAARAQVPLALPPGVYRTGMLRLASGTQLVGVRGATKLVFNGGASMLQGEGANSIGLSGITLDGGGIALPQRRGLVHCLGGRDVRIADCEITASGGNGIWLEQASGDISGNIFTKIATTAVVSFDAQGLIVSRNTIIDTSDNGIEILRTSIGDDGTLVLDNRIEDIKAGPGGSGQYGNAINAFRAGNVIVRGNRIRNCDYSAVRGNSASNIQISGNSVSNVREVALYSEFAFEGAVIANNTVDGAAVGVSVCNFNEGGRIAVVQGNIIRNLLPKRPIGTAPDDDAGIGIYVEADSSVTGNVIENAPSFGIIAGWGKYLRDVAIIRQRDPQCLRRRRRLGAARRGHGAGQQQHDFGNPTRRHRRARPRPYHYDRSVSRRRAALRAGRGRGQRGAAVVWSYPDALEPARQLHRIPQQWIALLHHIEPACRRRHLVHDCRAGRGRCLFGNNKRAFPHDRDISWSIARWRNSLLRRLRRRLKAHDRRAEPLIARQGRGVPAANPGHVDRGIVEGSFTAQQVAPGFDGGLGFLDVLQELDFAVKAAPASGLEQFGEVVQPTLGKSAPARDDLAAKCHVSVCH